MGLELGIKLDDTTRDVIRRLISEIEEALEVIKDKVRMEALSPSDKFALRYAIIQIVEALAVIATKLGASMDYPITGYSDAILFLMREGIIDRNTGEKLVRLARLRNILVHRYWEVDDIRIIREAQNNGIESIRRAIDDIRKLISER